MRLLSRPQPGASVLYSCKASSCTKCVWSYSPARGAHRVTPFAVSDGFLPHGGAAMLSQRVSLTKLEIRALSSWSPSHSDLCSGNVGFPAHPPFQGCPRYIVRGRSPAPLIAQASYLLEAQTGCDLSTIAGLWVDSMHKLGPGRSQMGCVLG